MSKSNEFSLVKYLFMVYFSFSFFIFTPNLNVRDSFYQCIKQKAEFIFYNNTYGRK